MSWWELYRYCDGFFGWQWYLVLVCNERGDPIA